VRSAAAVLVLLSLAGTGCSLQKPVTQADAGQSLVGKAAPDFAGTDLDGKPIRLSDFKGHPLLINFWASWCGPCRAEQPGLNAISAAYADRGLVIVGVDVRDTIGAARIHRDEFKVPYRSLFDQAGRLEYAYGIDAPPGTVLVDAQGVVREQVPGGLGEDVLRPLIDRRLFGGHG
jgi:cytochrome c biogenesis protein CcmG/thiol:disulfide interchange protein DsbE